MSTSAVVLALFGLTASFLPQEILSSAGAPASGPNTILVQLLGALYLSFAMVNWMGRTNLIGGIYSRPVAVGNTLHFTMGALALVKFVAGGTPFTPAFVLLGVYALFALAFALILLSHPLAEAS